MIVLLFSEDGQMVRVENYLDGHSVTQEMCPIEGLQILLKHYAKAHQVSKKTPFIAVLPEQWLHRSQRVLPRGQTPAQQEKIVRAYLTEHYGDAWLGQWQNIDDTRSCFSLCVCDAEKWQKISAILKEHRLYCHLLSAGEWQYRHRSQDLEDGYWGGDGFLLAIKEQRLIDAIFSTGKSTSALYEEMVVRHHRQQIHLENLHQWRQLPLGEPIEQTALERVSFQERGVLSFKQDKKLMGLAFLCVLLPALLLMILHGYEEQRTQEAPTTQIQQVATATVTRRSYS